MAFFRFKCAPDGRDLDASWGEATYYLELADTGLTARKLVVYSNGIVLQYDQDHLQDDQGRLQLEVVPPRAWGSLPYEKIPSEEFEKAWRTHTPSNR